MERRLVSLACSHCAPPIADGERWGFCEECVGAYVAEVLAADRQMRAEVAKAHGPDSSPTGSPPEVRPGAPRAERRGGAVTGEGLNDGQASRAKAPVPPLAGVPRGARGDGQRI